jgi:hypothetical protein
MLYSAGRLSTSEECEMYIGDGFELVAPGLWPEEDLLKLNAAGFSLQDEDDDDDEDEDPLEGFDEGELDDDDDDDDDDWDDEDEDMEDDE